MLRRSERISLQAVGGKKPLIKDLHGTLVVTTQGLCKLGSAGGTDFSMKQFAEGSTLKLAKQCRKYVCLSES